MATLWPYPMPLSPLQPHKHNAISRPLISNPQIPTAVALKNYSVSISASPTNCCSSLQITSSGSISSDSMESDTSSPTGVFVKGLPECTMEGRLKKVFSQFGEVVQVKLVIERKSKQFLGSAFLWFSRKESAELAVEEMNGKFFDGRFILVKIAESGLSKNRGRRTRYKF